MSVLGTTLYSGHFTKTGAATGTAASPDVHLMLASGVDWFRVINWTVAGFATSTTSRGIIYEWRRGMPANDGIVHIKISSKQASSNRPPTGRKTLLNSAYRSRWISGTYELKEGSRSLRGWTSL